MLPFFDSLENDQRLEFQPPQPAQGVSPVEPIAASRMILPTAWHVLMFATMATFTGFMTLDPEPSLLLSVSAAANVAIMLWAIYRMYQWDLLISPMATIFIGPSMLLFYSWGNLGARIAGGERYVSNLNSLDFYPQVALLTTIALALFCWVVFGLFARYARYARLRYQDLYWQPWQVLIASFIAMAILLYLSLKYPFTGGYFRGVNSYLDRWLSAFQYFFVVLTAIISVSVITRATDRQAKLFGLFGLLVSLLLALGLRSRTFMLTLLLMMGLCWITLQPHRLRSILLGCGLIAIIFFTLGTVVKKANSGGDLFSIWDNLSAVKDTNFQNAIVVNRNGLELDYQYRLAGFEFPAAILQCLEHGVQPMYGDGVVSGILQNVPGFLRPAGNWSERNALGQHFIGRCLRYDDSIGVPLTSGLADWGLLGFLLYGVMALYCLLLWRVVQASPRLFAAYLMAGTTPIDLFWDNGLYVIRTIGFAWLILWVLDPLLMPRWQPSSGPSGRAVVRMDVAARIE